MAGGHWGWRVWDSGGPPGTCPPASLPSLLGGAVLRVAPALAPADFRARALGQESQSGPRGWLLDFATCDITYISHSDPPKQACLFI